MNGGNADRSFCSASLKKILNLNHSSPETPTGSHDPPAANGFAVQAAPILNADGDPIWKVLVFDNLGRDVISSVLRVNDLRGWGVTIHLYVKEQETKTRWGNPNAFQ
jgi:hypothetical protein